ncbi:MAG: hypothetical protein IPK99_06815 [Flavobacteriales bacterium]|nr:hypothetical protein [Flavobacteriales bacterium]
MCFSANASFAASAILVTAGAYSVSMGRRSGQWAFGVIPLIFSIQQFVEGLVWLRLSDAGPPEAVVAMARAFLLFSQVLWPIWVPYAVLCMEPDRGRRRWLRWMLAAGTVTGAYYLWTLLSVPPIASVENHHIHYTMRYRWDLEHPIAALYFIATVLSVFTSSLRRMWVLGVALLTSYAVARIEFTGNVISVWCYFAALISISIIYLQHRFRAAHRAQFATAAVPLG